MKYNILKNQEKYEKQEFKTEENLTQLFTENYQSIISSKSFFIKIKKQLKSRKFKNFKHSIGDGFLLVWENPTTPTLYVVEIELEKHDINKHILPQIGDFISFIQSATTEELNAVRNYLYQEIKDNKEIFTILQKETNKEVYELLDNSMEDLQILLIIDRICPELSIGLSQIEKAIKVKIRKLEISLFTKAQEKVILFSDSEVVSAETDISKFQELEEYPLEYHFQNKSEKITNIVKEFLKYLKTKRIKESPMKQYIGFFKNQKMIFSCVVRKNSVVFYSKANRREIKTKNLSLLFRDVKKIGHYTNHLPTEIVLTEIEQLEDLKKYFNEVYNKY